MTPTNAHSRRTVRIGLVSLTVATCLALAACSGGGDSDTAESEPTPTTAVSAATTPPSSTPDSSASTTAANVTAPGAVDELDDLDEDGEFDPRCGTADLGGGLIVETLCSATLAPTPEEGVIPLPNSLLTLPSPPRWEDLAGVDAVVKVATRLGGGRVVIYVLGSDTLFDSGRATIRSTAQPPLEAIVASIAARFPGQPITVRGAADSVGAPAANQTLSEQRATAVVQQLIALGLPAGAITSLGLGETVPVAAETNPDGSVSPIGQQVNRRVEIVVG